MTTGRRECGRRLTDRTECWLPRAFSGNRVELGLRRLRDIGVSPPSFVLDLDRLDEDRVGVRVEICLRREFADPSAEHLVGQDLLAGLVEHVDSEVAPEVPERDLALP